MTISNVKAMVAKVITAGLLAGAFMMAAPVKAEAQAVQFGIQIGHPAFGYGPRFHDDHIRRGEYRAQEDWARRQDWVRHDEWVRAHEFHGYRHNAPYWYR